MQASLVYKNVGKTLNLLTRYVDEERHAELLQIARTAYEDSRVLWTTMWKEHGNLFLYITFKHCPTHQL